MNKEKKTKDDFQKIYDRESLSNDILEKKIENEKSGFLSFLDKSLNAGQGEEGPDSKTKEELKNRLNQVCNHFLPHYTKTDLLAVKYQKRYRRASLSIYLMAGLAVLVVSAQYIFHNLIPDKAIWGEIALMLGVTLVIFIGNKVGWHRRWLEYRHLAERLRYGLFVAFFTNKSSEKIKEDFHANWLEDSWSIRFYKKVWTQRPQLNPIDQESLKCMLFFLDSVWLEGQIKYHKNKSRKELRKHEKISLIGEFFFRLTIVAAFLHVFHIGGEYFGKIWTFLAIAFPITGSAFSALRAHFEYKKIGERSKMMGERLFLLQERLKEISDWNDFMNLVTDAEALMLQENADWRLAIGIHDLETPA